METAKWKDISSSIQSPVFPQSSPSSDPRNKSDRNYFSIIHHRRALPRYPILCLTPVSTLCFKTKHRIPIWRNNCAGKTSRFRPGQAKPSQAKQSQAKPGKATTGQAKPSQIVNSEAETCAKRKSTSPCPLAIPAFHHIAGLYKRHLNSNKWIWLH